MDDERWEAGMPALERQAPRLPPSLAGQPPRSVPETAPTPLQRHYVNLSVVALIAGAIAITAVELGAPLGHPLVKLGAIVAAPILLVTTADAAVRIWRSARAWMPVNRGRALFRLAWLVPALAFVAATLAVAGAILVA
jgi:hypothetical protein